MSLKIKISYTDEAELSLVRRHLAPLNMRFKLPKRPLKARLSARI